MDLSKAAVHSFLFVFVAPLTGGLWTQLSSDVSLGKYVVIRPSGLISKWGTPFYLEGCVTKSPAQRGFKGKPFSEAYEL